MKTRSTPASLLFRGLVTKSITVKWSIERRGREGESLLAAGEREDLWHPGYYS